MDRRSFLRAGVVGAASLAGLRHLGVALPSARAAAGPYGDLGAADALGIELPAGFTARVVATSGVVVPGSTYTWHNAPDGGACFATPDGGWIYVSNCERSAPNGGAASLRFDATGAVVGAHRILTGTARNCAGGATPWGTWLSCEENTTLGQVWECDPMGVLPAVARPAMGLFNHEAAACDTVRKRVYLTEDSGTGKLYRYTPVVWGDLSVGTLESAVVSGSTVTWTPSILSGTWFNGGEGCWYADGKVWFTTKGDNRVWELDVAATPNTIKVIYDNDWSPTPTLTGVDNVVGSVSGDLFVAEDGGNMELVLLEPSGAVSPFARFTNQAGSELCGPAFSPDGTRMYVSSQRGPTGAGLGVTYEIRGPFRTSTSPTTTTTATTATTTTTAPPTTTSTSTTTTSTSTTTTSTTSTTVPPTTTTTTSTTTTTVPPTTTTTTSTTVPPTTTTTTAPVVITLTAIGKVSGRKNVVDLRWSGATASKVEVRRDDKVIATTTNDGAHTDSSLKAGVGTYRYRITHPGGTPASNEVTVTFTATR